MLKVLLISPQDPKIPSNLKFLMGGENTYTQTLLKHPPNGISYTYYIDAIKQGDIYYTSWQKILRLLIQLRILPLDSGVCAIRLKKHFDIIHCHGYNLKIDGKMRPPVILGDSSSNFLFLKDYLNWSNLRIYIYYKIRKWIYSLIGVMDRDLLLTECSRLLVFSNFAKKVHAMLAKDAKKIHVIYPGLPSQEKIPLKRKKEITILFAGVWFERKGGRRLLEAYFILRKKYNRIRLVILGPIPKDIKLNDPTIEHHNYVSYDRLLTEFYPKTDIFVLTPEKAEGFGMVVLEVASFGIPAIISSVYALPELVINKKTGFVVKPGSIKELVLALEKLISNPKLRKKMGDAARQRFLTNYSFEITNKKLLILYKKALGIT